MYVDSHCHLSFPELAGDIDTVLERMASAGVTAALNVCVTLEEFPQVLALAQRRPEIWASVGVHPDYQGVREPDVEELVRLAEDPRVVAIGETGLDYYRLKEPLEWQRQRFRTHIRAARECGKPLIVHSRAAAEDTLRIMREERAGDAGGVMHCFTESLAVAREAMDMGFYISFSGIVTFRNATELQATAAAVPLERLLVETDAPYLAPVPHRGKRNEPAYVARVAEKIAALHGVTPDLVAGGTGMNFRRLFRILGTSSKANSLEGARPSSLEKKVVGSGI